MNHNALNASIIFFNALNVTISTSYDKKYEMMGQPCLPILDFDGLSHIKLVHNNFNYQNFQAKR